MFKNRRREQRGSHFTITKLEPDHRRKEQKSRDEDGRTLGGGRKHAGKP